MTMFGHFLAIFLRKVFINKIVTAQSNQLLEYLPFYSLNTTAYFALLIFFN